MECTIKSIYNNDYDNISSKITNNKENNIESKSNNSSKKKSNNSNSKTNNVKFEKDSNSEFLSIHEKDFFYSLLGFLYYNMEIKRDYKLPSVESIYGIYNFMKKLSLIMEIL